MFYACFSLPIPTPNALRDPCGAASLARPPTIILLSNIPRGRGGVKPPPTSINVCALARSVSSSFSGSAVAARSSTLREHPS
jgi:hypothetical protein